MPCSHFERGDKSHDIVSSLNQPPAREQESRHPMHRSGPRRHPRTRRATQPEKDGAPARHRHGTCHRTGLRAESKWQGDVTIESHGCQNGCRKTRFPVCVCVHPPPEDHKHIRFVLLSLQTGWQQVGSCFLGTCIACLGHSSRENVVIEANLQIPAIPGRRKGATFLGRRPHLPLTWAGYGSPGSQYPPQSHHGLRPARLPWRGRSWLFLEGSHHVWLESRG